MAKHISSSCIHEDQRTRKSARDPVYFHSYASISNINGWENVKQTQRGLLSFCPPSFLLHLACIEEEAPWRELYAPSFLQTNTACAPAPFLSPPPSPAQEIQFARTPWHLSTVTSFPAFVLILLNPPRNGQERVGSFFSFLSSFFFFFFFLPPSCLCTQRTDRIRKRQPTTGPGLRKRESLGGRLDAFGLPAHRHQAKGKKSLLCLLTLQDKETK